MITTSTRPDGLPENFLATNGQPHRERGNDLRGGGVEMQTRSRVPEIRPVTAAEAPSINGQHTRFWGSCGSMCFGDIVRQSLSRGSVRPASPNFPQRRKQKWLTALAVIGNTLGGLLLFCAAFWFVTMLSYALHSAGVL